MRRDLGAAGITLIVMTVIAVTGLSADMGAHPFWADTVAWVGLPIGLALAISLRWVRLSWGVRMAILVAVIALAYAFAAYGKGQFAASYAEDKLAGQFWFFGWIAAMTGLSGVLFTALGKTWR